MFIHKNLIWVAILSTLLLSACDKDPLNPDDQNKNNKFVCDVEWTPSTVYFDEDAVADLIHADTSEYRYYFSKNSDLANGLNEGDIIFIHGLALRKVEYIEDQGDEIMVETGYATLNEAVDNGEIAWEYEAGFTELQAPELLIDGKTYPYLKSGEQTFSITLKVGEYDYKVEMKFKGDHAEVTQQIEKKIDSLIKVRFECKGVIDRFTTKTKIIFENSQVTNYETINEHLKGELTLSITAIAAGTDFLNFEFPVTLLKYPFLVHGIPVVVNVKVLFVAQTAVPPEGSSLMSARFTYDSSTGIGYMPGKGVFVLGEVGDFDIVKEQAQTGAASAIAINFGLGFPRLELQIFGESIIPWIHTAFLLGGDYTFYPACQQAKAMFIGACGFKLKFFGLFEAEGSTTLWNEEKILLQAGDCGGQAIGFNPNLLTTDPNLTSTQLSF